jgi:hypothetical protein
MQRASDFAVAILKIGFAIADQTPQGKFCNFEVFKVDKFKD